MAGNEVKLKVTAENKVMAGLRSVSNSLKSWGASAKKFLSPIQTGLSAIAKGAAATGAGMMAMAGLAVRAFEVQESAEQNLAAALRAHGDDVDALMPKYKALAATIQDQTGVADEQSLAQMALARNLGVTVDKMDDAIKMSIALEKVGMSGNQAMRATAAALGGNYSMLTRYVPALRMATSEEEKAAIVQGLITTGFQQQQAALNTLSGRWRELKGRIGDTLEKIGQGIVDGLKLRETMASWSEAIKRFQESEAFDGFIEKLKAGLEMAKAMVNAFAQGGESRAQAWQAVKDILVGALATGANAAGNALLAFAPVIGHAIGEGAKKAFGGLKDARALREEAIGNVASQTGRSRLGTVVRDMPFTKTKQMVDAEVSRLARERAISAGVEMASGLGGIDKRLSQGLDTLRQLAAQERQQNKDVVKAKADEEKRQQPTLAKAKADEEKKQVPEVAAVELDEKLNTIETAKEAEIEAVKEVAEARQKEFGKPALAGAAMPDLGAFAGSSVTPQMVRDYSGYELGRSMDLEARRIESIVGSFMKATGMGKGKGNGREKVLQEIADNTAATSKTLATAIGMS